MAAAARRRPERIAGEAPHHEMYQLLLQCPAHVRHLQNVRGVMRELSDRLMKLQQLRHRRGVGTNDAHLVIVRKVMAGDDLERSAQIALREGHCAFANIGIEALVHHVAAADDDVTGQDLLSAVEQFR
jgi:hypothetical protein